MRVEVPGKHVHRLLNHGPTTLVTTAHGGRRNVMAAAWARSLANPRVARGFAYAEGPRDAPIAALDDARAERGPGRRPDRGPQWVMPLDFEPPKFAAVIAADTLTRELLAASGECVLAAPTTLQLDLTYRVGTTSGREIDKFDRFGIATSPARCVAAPLVDGCAAWLECRVLAEPALAERHDLFVLECVAAWADDALWRDGEWHFAPTGPRTIHHCKGGVFFATGERIAAARP